MSKIPLTSEDTAGFTLVELVIVVALMIVVGLVAIADIAGRAPYHRMDRTVSELLSQLRAARMQAVSQNLDVNVDFDTATNEFITEADLNRDGSITAEETTKYPIEDFEDVTITFPAEEGQFAALGTFSSEETSWEIQLQSAVVGSKYVQVYPSGHIRRSDSPAQ